MENATLKLPANPPVYGFKLEAITNASGNVVIFSLPGGFVSPPGETNRLFVIEKTGNIAVITNLAAPTRTVFLNLSYQVQQQLGTSDVAMLAAWITNSLPGYEDFEAWQSNHVWTVPADADLSADPDHDGAVNYLEYLTGTDPLDNVDSWRINFQRSGNDVEIVFSQIANRGFQVEYADELTDPMIWTPLDMPGNAPFCSVSNFTKTVVDTPVNNRRYYRARVFEP